MALTPLEIHNKEFRRAFRGYSEQEVDSFLDQVVEEFEAMIREKERLQAEIQQYRHLEETLKQTLVVAQEAAEELKSNARKEAELILKEARLQAENILQEAKAQVARVVQEYEGLKKEMGLFRTRVRTLVQGYLELLEKEE